MIKFSKQKKPLSGEILVQGDKEISYFSIILSALANGKSKICGLLESKNVLNLVKILGEFGIEISKNPKDCSWIINGNGLDGFVEPKNIIDIGNSDEILYMLVGFLSSYDFKMFFKGDDQIANENLEYIFNIFRSLGINFNARNSKNLPFLMDGSRNKKALDFEIPNYDTALKDILILSSINTQKENRIVEKERSKNHLEVLLKHFGIAFGEHDIGNKGNLSTKVGKEIILRGGQNFSAKEVTIPSDTSFSAFIAILGILVKNSSLTLKNVLMNQYRDAIYRTLIDMGANITFVNQKIVCGEKVCDINICAGKLRDTTVPASRIYKMVDDFPSLILVSCMTDAKIEIQGTKIIKEHNPEDYRQIIKIMDDLGVDFKDEADSLKIMGSITNIGNKINIDKKITNPNIVLMGALFGLFTNEAIEIDKNIDDYFPGLRNCLKSINVNVD